MYYLLILAVGIERLIELLVAKRNARWALAHGGKEFGHDHYPVMVVLHTALLLGCVIEVWALHRPFLAMARLANAGRGGRKPGAALVVCGDAGPTLEHPVIVLPEAPLVQRGPYRWLHHPNYVAVVAEGVALPLVHTAWLTAIGFTLANALLLTVRIRVENSALGYA